MRHALAPLLAALALAAAPAAGQAAEKKPAPAKKPAAGPTAAADKGVRFELPAGFSVRETVEAEHGEAQDTVWVARQGKLEVRVEVEEGEQGCTEKSMGAPPKAGKTAAGLETCEAALAAPPSLDPAIGARKAVALNVQFPGRALMVLAFAPDTAAAAKLARQVAETGALEK